MKLEVLPMLETWEGTQYRRRRSGPVVCGKISAEACHARWLKLNAALGAEVNDKKKEKLRRQLKKAAEEFVKAAAGGVKVKPGCGGGEIGTWGLGLYHQSVRCPEVKS